MRRRTIWLLIGFFIAGIVGVTYWGFSVWQENEKEHAVSETKQYMKEYYPQMKYQLEAVDVSHGWWNDFKFYGYYAYEVMVRDTETGESFGIYYDRNMKYMDDSKHMEEQDEWCFELSPLIEEYLTKQFGDSQTSDIYYSVEERAPYIHIEFEETIPFMTETEWENFQTFLKSELGIQDGKVAVYYGYTKQFFETQL